MKETFLSLVWEAERIMRDFRLNVFILLVKWEMRSSTENEKASNRKGHLERMEKIENN